MILRSFSEILSQAPDVKEILLHQEQYWAHIHSEKTPESLSEHIDLVNHYAGRLFSDHGLDEIVDRIICDYGSDWADEFIRDFIKTLFVHSIVFHDFGKINENFQFKRMGNMQFKTKDYNSFMPDYGHSYLSAFIYVSYHISKIIGVDYTQKTKSKLISLCFFFAYPILQHHSPALFNAIEKDGLFSRFKNVLKELEIFLKSYQVELETSILDSIFSNMEKIWFDVLSQDEETEVFPLFVLLKLNFSILTTSDYLATHDYMNSNYENEYSEIRFGLIKDQKRLNEIYEFIKSFKYNAETYASLNTHEVGFPKERSSENLNLLRKQIAVEVVRQIKNNTDSNLFYLEAPTGSGKTNLSALALVELLKANKELKNVFYVFPFTTLITQTYGVLKESLGLKEYEIIELHSKAQLGSKKEEIDDGSYGDEKRDFIDNQFVLYPFTLLSHVKFFNILKSNTKEDNYLLHRLANSIVIIDEIQSYNPIIWDKMIFLIGNYAKYFNIKFVLMSATLPKISNLKVGLKNKMDFIELLPKSEDYLSNINFSGRVCFNMELLENRELSIEHLKSFVLEKSIDYCKKEGSVKTIVEFIYKKTATAFQRLFEADVFFDEVLVLSGTILEPRRMEVVNFLKRNNYTKKNILLITTQVVEAGVDIDMDLGFKNVSLLDSDEQLAGRVNRNAKKNNSKVYLFNIDDARVLYGKDYRFIKTAEMSIEERAEILEKKEFRRLYEKVLLSIDDKNNPVYADSISTYQSHFRNLRFQDVDKDFQIINQSNSIVFIPIDIPIILDGIKENIVESVFSEDELLFLSSFGVYPKYIDCKKMEFISGKDVWSIYEGFVSNRRKGVGFEIKRKIDFKKLQGIMSKYCFSLISHSKDYKEMQNGFGYEQYGYFYFDHYDEIRENGRVYDYLYGLNVDAFSDSNFI